jgi:molybdopterin-guanine dinucleotide biosynthesis protein A
MNADLGIVILAGGDASRLPGKLARVLGGEPLLTRVYRNVHSAGETYVSVRGNLDVVVPCPVVLDRWPARGPLSGVLSTLQAMQTRYAFVVAGDAPFIDAAFIKRLAAQRTAGDEAVVPRHAAGIEPLAALYDRHAFLREGLPLLVAGTGAGVRDVIARLNTRFVPFADAAPFANVNTPADETAIAATLMAVSA